MEATRRKIVELLGKNNGRTVATAELEDDSWRCEAFVFVDGYRSTIEREVVCTRNGAEAWLREIGQATSIIACPAID